MASGELSASLRLTQPGAMVAFGKLDVVSAGYQSAVQAARNAGYEAVERLAGGRAAVFHEGVLALAWALPAADPPSGIDARYEQAASMLTTALRRLGVDARVGEVAGEWCPGGWSINARGRVKIAGIGQRLVSGAAYVGAVIVAADPDRVREVLGPVYAELGLPWDPATAGSVADEVGGASLDDVIAAIDDEYAARYDLDESSLDESTLALARRLAPEHRSP